MYIYFIFTHRIDLPQKTHYTLFYKKQRQVIVLIFPKSTDEIRKTIENNKIVLVQFGSASCSPCTAIRHRIEEHYKNRTDIPYIYISVEKFPEAAAQTGILSVPSIQVYVDGSLTIQESGCFGLEEIFEKTERYCRLINS